MSKFFLWSGLLILSIGTVHSTDLRVATLNCEFLNSKKIHMKYGEDFVFDGWDDETRISKLIEASKLIADEVSSINADVIVLTEVGNEDDVGVLLDFLDYPFKAVAKSTDYTTGQSVAILSRFSLSDVLTTIPGREFYDQEADDADSEKDTGLSKGLRAAITVDGKKVYIYGIHLKSERGYSEADGQRVAQASIVRRHYLQLLQAGERVIVIGDLNDKRGDPTLRRIRGRDDIGPDLIQTGIYKYWENPSDRWTYEYQGERNQIDHILPNMSLKKGLKASVHIPEGYIGDKPITDHRGLIVDFKI